MKRNLSEYTDSELFYMLQKDKTIAEKAFAELYTRLSPRIYAYCLRFIGNKEEAQDIFQEAFAKFFESAKQDRLMTNVPAFLLRITRNICINFVRKKEALLSYEDYMAPEASSQDSNELLQLIKSALELLSEDSREIFILREYDGLSYKDIAEIIDEPISTVKIRIFRAKQKIREILEPYLKELQRFN